MVKITTSKDVFCDSEQYDCSSLKADEPPLEELDPAILSCGLPAIIISDIPTMFTVPVRYTNTKLLSLRHSSLCFRRPVVADDPIIGRFNIWKSADQLKRLKQAFSVADGRDDRTHGPARPGNYTRHTDRRINPKRRYELDNGFAGPRVRRNYEFSNRNHHVIVKSYNGVEEHRLQDTIIEEEPEWVAAGPTSRLDTIELRGFDEDVSFHGLSTSQLSLEKSSTDGKNTGSSSSEKHISFYDELHHYEHVHPKRSGGTTKQHDSSGNDVESVATSNTSSPPPARSTPTKYVSDTENNHKITDGPHQHQSGVNVNNFEQFMKLDSFLGNDAPSGGNAGSRFSKWFRRSGNSFHPSNGSNFDGRKQNTHNDNFNYGQSNNRYQTDRNPYQQRHASFSNRSFQSESCEIPNNSAGSSNAFKQLVNMVAHNRINNNLIAQQQFLMQLLCKSQQSELLRRMVIKNDSDANVDNQSQSQQQQQHRMPTQRELQFHTQSIMQNALLRKKLQDQRRIVFEQANQIIAASVNAEANPTVQQFVQSVSPDLQRSLSVLSQATTGSGQHQFNQTYCNGNSSTTGQFFAGGPTQQDLSASLQQMLLSQSNQSQRVGSNKRFGKGSVTWNHTN